MGGDRAHGSRPRRAALGALRDDFGSIRDSGAAHAKPAKQSMPRKLDPEADKDCCARGGRGGRMEKAHLQESQL